MDRYLNPSANGMRAAVIFVLLAVSACAPRLIDPGPRNENLMAATLNHTALIAADGFELPIKRWLPAAGEPEAVIVALHGFNDYSNAFADIGAWLESQDIGLYAYDQRGFGATSQAGLWAGAAPMIADLRAMLRAVKQRHPGSRIYALGDSMGGAVIISAWGERPLAVDGIILVGPAVRGRAVMPPYQQMALWLSAHTMPWLQVS
ncbi:MAG: alpha/beta fold hydrolase, partial [Alphaproteobacteria bacterium]